MLFIFAENGKNAVGAKDRQKNIHEIEHQDLTGKAAVVDGCAERMRNDKNNTAGVEQHGGSGSRVFLRFEKDKNYQEKEKNCVNCISDAVNQQVYVHGISIA